MPVIVCCLFVYLLVSVLLCAQYAAVCSSNVQYFCAVPANDTLFSPSPLVRYVVLPKDFDKGYKKNVRKADTEHEFYVA